MSEATSGNSRAKMRGPPGLRFAPSGLQVRIGTSVDAITIQILRNKVASLVDEMHYHFYRSGYSTIIRESRDFSCVILDREGRLIVAPPMFFHAPVHRHLVGRILKLYGGTDAIKDGDVFAAILKGAADELRGAIAKLPGGESSAEGLLDSDGVVIDKPVKLAVTVAIKNGIASFDFSNSAPQARGPVNLRPSMVEACVFYSLIGCLGPNLHFNDGMREVVRLIFAPRTVTNAEPPAPVSNYQMVNLKLVDVILEALGRFHPARAIANARSSSPFPIAFAKGRPRQSNMQYEINASAYGGGMGHSVASVTATHLRNLHINPIEIPESQFPCRITR